MKVSYRNLTTDDFRPENQEEAEMMYRVRVQEEIMGRRFVLSANRTPELNYDDRLQVRLGFKRTTIFKLIKENKLQLIPVEGKIMMTERAIRRFEDGLPTMQVVGSSTLQAA